MSKLFAEWFVDSSSSRLLGVSWKIWILVTISQIFTIKHLLAEGINNLLYLSLNPIIWIVGVVFISPAVENTISFKYSYKNDIQKLFNALFSEENTKLVELTEPSGTVINVGSLLITLFLIALWIGPVVDNTDIYMKLAWFPYSVLWLIAISVVLYSLWFSFSSYKIFNCTSVNEYFLHKWVLTLSQESIENKNKTPLKEFKRLLNTLKRLFSPTFSISLRIVTVIGLATFSLGVINMINKSIPSFELLQFKQTLYLVVIPSLIFVVIFSYIIVRASSKLKSVLLVEIKEAKIHSSDIHSRTIIEEMEKILLEDELLLLSARNFGEIVASIIAILANGIVLIVHLAS